MRIFFRFNVVLSFSLGLIFCSCAKINGKLRFNYTGEIEIGKNQAVVKKMDELRRNPGDLSKIKVYVGSLPEKMHGRSEYVQLLGQYNITVRRPIYGVGFPDYRSTGMKALCYPQVVLTWVTAFVWYAVPTSYPCWEAAWTEEEWIHELKLAAKAVGGNVVLAPSANFENFIQISGMVFKVDTAFLESISNDKVFDRSEDNQIPPADRNDAV
jgi:hypothetical protein